MSFIYVPGASAPPAGQGYVRYQLSTGNLVAPLLNFLNLASAAVYGVLGLTNGGTGDANFSWTAATKTLIANAIEAAVGATQLLFSTPGVASGAGSSGGIALKTGNVGGSGNVGSLNLAGGDANSGTAGSFELTAGNSDSGTGGDFYMTGGNSSSGSPGVMFFFCGINTTTQETQPGGLAFGDNGVNFYFQAQTNVGAAPAIAFYNNSPVEQATTSGAASSYTANVSANIVYEGTTFDGYTIGVVVKALRNIGILT